MALDSIISELDNLADISIKSHPAVFQQYCGQETLASIENYQRVERVAIENPFANEVVEKKSRLPWIIGMILVLLGIFFVSIHLNKDNSSVSKEAMTDSHEGSTYKRSMTDSRDGKTYKTVKIGSQIWMAENLNFRTKDSWCNDNKESNCSKYGRLYTWNAAIKACPSGWHLPSKVEFETLFTAVGGKLTAGKMLKSQSGWYYNGNGIDAYGFSALPAPPQLPWRFSYADKNAYFWSATKLGKYDAFYLYLYYRSETVYLYDYNKDNALSVRCLRD